MHIYLILFIILPISLAIIFSLVIYYLYLERKSCPTCLERNCALNKWEEEHPEEKMDSKSEQPG
jgi:hypothetical protein